MSQPTAAERRRAKLRLAIISNATSLYKKNGSEDGGFEKTSIEEIAEMSDISLRTFFRYFETKLDVIYLDIKSARSDLLTFIEERPNNEGRIAAAVNGRLAQIRWFLDEKENRERLLRSLSAHQFQGRLVVLRSELKACILEFLTREEGPSAPLSVKDGRMIATLIIDIVGDIMDDWSVDPSINIRDQAFDIFKRLPTLSEQMKKAIKT